MPHAFAAAPRFGEMPLLIIQYDIRNEIQAGDVSTGIRLIGYLDFPEMRLPMNATDFPGSEVSRYPVDWNPMPTRCAGVLGDQTFATPWSFPRHLLVCSGHAFSAALVPEENAKNRRARRNLTAAKRLHQLNPD